MRLELKTYQDEKQLWTKWAKFKRYVKVWKEEGVFFLFFTLLSRFLYLLSFPANHTKNYSTLWVGLDIGWLTRKVYIFKFSRCFWFAVIAQGARQRAYVAKKTRKKTFPFCFWFTAIVQGAQKRAYVAREGNSPRLKQ